MYSSLGGFIGGCFNLSSEHSQSSYYCMSYDDKLHYCLPNKCIIVVQHLVFYTSIEKLSAALKRKSTLRQNVHMVLLQSRFVLLKHFVYMLQNRQYKIAALEFNVFLIRGFRDQPGFIFFCDKEPPW